MHTPPLFTRLARTTKSLSLLVLVMFLTFVTGVSAQISDENTDLSKLSLQDMQSNATKMLANIERVRKYISDELEKAKRDNDMAAYDCLNEHLTTVKTLQNLALTANNQLQEVVNSKSSEEEKRENATREYIRISQAESSVLEREAQAKLCTGKASSYTGDTQVLVDKPSDQDTVDPTIPPYQPGVYMRRVDASNFY